VGARILQDEKTGREIADFIHSYGVKTVVRSPHILGCPHEEGPDFPEGGDCPFCPFWKGKQGSGAKVPTQWDKVTYLPVSYLSAPKEILGTDFAEGT
jgi:hypothetical protein